VIKDVSLGAMSIFTWLLAVLRHRHASAEGTSRTARSTPSSPNPCRVSSTMLGKFLGVLLLLFIAISLMTPSSWLCSTPANRALSTMPRTWSRPAALDDQLAQYPRRLPSTAICFRASPSFISSPRFVRR